MSEEKRFDDECLDVEYGFKGISRFTCYKPTYTIDEWENQEIIKEWDIMRVKEDYFSFLVYVNKIFKENEQLKSALNEVLELLEEEVDIFSDKATENDLKAYVELQTFDNKDAYYMATTTKKAIELLKKELEE